MKKNKKILILGILIFTIICVYLVYLFITNTDTNSRVRFKLLDIDTSQTVRNTEILICDDSIEFDRSKGQSDSHFCDNRKIHGSVKTDSNGQFIYDISSLEIFTPSIVFDAGRPHEFVMIQRSNDLKHTPNETHLRIITRDKTGHVISNKFYDLVKMEVREVFTDGRDDAFYPFEVIELKTYSSN